MSLREPSGRPSGGQKGHKGETLRQTAEPDRIVTHEAACCGHCGSGLSQAMAAGLERRQVFDLPERLIAVTEHQGLVYPCARCGERTRAAFPDGVTGPIWRAVRAASVYLHVQHLIPEDRMAKALADRIGAESLCGASVAEWARRRTAALEPVTGRTARRPRKGRRRP